MARVGGRRQGMRTGGMGAQVSISLFWFPAGVSLAGGFRQKALWTRRPGDMLEIEAVGVEIYK